MKNELYQSQEPNTDFETILHKNKIEPLGDLQHYDKILDVGCGSVDVFNNIENLPKMDAIEPNQRFAGATRHTAAATRRLGQHDTATCHTR